MLQSIGKSRGLRLLMLALFLQLVIPVSVPGQIEGVVRKVRLEVFRDRAYVDFELPGSASDRYTVTVTLLREGNPDFRYVPQNVTGDVGPGIRGGGARRIVWKYLGEYTEGLGGEGYYVDIVAVPTKPEGGISPLILVAAGVAVVGGLVALVLSQGGNGNDGGGGTSGFPPPTGRP